MHTAKRILLVEDDLDDQQFFREALHRVHPAISCDIANNGLEALTVIEKPPPFDMIFMDLNMPKMDGFECLKVLKQDPKHKHIPVVIVSTTDSYEDIEKTKQLGATSFFTKPSSYDGLFHKLKGILAAS